MKVSTTETIGACGGLNAITTSCGNVSAKNPEGLVSWIVLARVNVDEELGLALFNGIEKQQRCRCQNR